MPSVVYDPHFNNSPRVKPSLTGDQTINSVLQQLSSGGRDTLPLIFAAIPFGIVFGALGQANGLPWWATVATSMFVFAGASQFIAVTMIAAGASPPIIVLTVFLVNLRHMLYAISLIPFVSQLPTHIRLIMAFFLTDETFAVAFNRGLSENNPHHFSHYYFGSGLLMYSNWVLCTCIGMVAGNQSPALTEFGLDVAMVVAFIGIVVPHLKMTSHWLCAATAAVLGVICYDWPHQTGLLFSALVAIAIGVISENTLSKPASVLEDSP